MKKQHDSMLSNLEKIIAEGFKKMGVKLEDKYQLYDKRIGEGQYEFIIYYPKKDSIIRRYKVPRLRKEYYE